MFATVQFFNKGKGLSKFKRAFFLLIFFICSHAYALDPASHPTRQASGGNQIACPSRDFSEFIKVFSESKEVQMMFTKYPLKYVQVLDAASEPVPKESIKFLSKEEIKFPVLLDRQGLIRYGLKLNDKKIDDETYIAIETSSGEKSLGHYVEYKFKRIKNCWRLTEINDQST